MDLSYTIDGKQAKLSPDGLYVASLSKHVLTIRRADVIASTVAQPFLACDLIHYIEWSPDSQYVLCAITLRGKVQIFSISDSNFECTIDQGALQLAHATWLYSAPPTTAQNTPYAASSKAMHTDTDADADADAHARMGDGRALYVVLYSTHGLYASVWSLATKTCAHIANPKFTRQGLDSCALPLSATDVYTVGAMVTRHGTRDCVCVFPYNNADLFCTTDTDATPDNVYTAHMDTTNERTIGNRAEGRAKEAGDSTHIASADAPNLTQQGNGIGAGNEFVIADSSEVGGVAWSPVGDGTLCVWEGAFGEMVRLYSLEGKLLGECNIKQDYFAGYRNSRSHPDTTTDHTVPPSTDRKAGSGQITRTEVDITLCIKYVTWAPDGSAVAVGTYTDTVVVINALVWKPLWMAAARDEVDGSKVGIFLEESNRDGTTAKRLYRICTDKLTLPAVKQDKLAPSVGMGLVQFSADAQHMAARCDTQPNVLYIWNLKRFELQSVLIQLEPILHFSWRPHKHTTEIAVSTGNGHVYMWSPKGTALVTLDIDADAQGFSCRSFIWGKPTKHNDRTRHGDTQTANTDTTNSNGDRALAVDVDRFIVCHLPPPDPPAAETDAHEDDAENTMCDGDGDMSDGSDCVEY